MFDNIRRIFLKIESMFMPTRVSTSMSDNQKYPQVCLDAFINYRKFNVFRQHPIYTSIVETVTKELGEEYLGEVKKDKEIFSSINELLSNDDWGGPKTFQYQSIKASPTTLRYVKVASDLKRYFGRLALESICEIGVGYGGQCRIIDNLFKPREYFLIDIRPALLLAQKYLDNYICSSILHYYSMNELPIVSYDLCISNYALSELPRRIQDIYLEKVVLASKMGYITYSNNFSPESFNSYTLKELNDLIPGSFIVPEYPLTGPNSIIIWGAK